MCGILGFSGSFASGLLAQGSQLQGHRGPDDSGQYYDNNFDIGLGHVRLSILDTSHLGHQPMVSDDGSVVLVYNGEIYNYKELRSELEAKGHQFRGHSDTEVLLHLYLAYGERTLARLNGVFAFAIWDMRKQMLFLARDAFGVKPLYYADINNGFAFASEIKSLIALVPHARELDIPSLHRYMSFLWCPGEGTPLRGVRKLTPGEALLVQAGKIVKRWLWYRLPACHAKTGKLSEADALRDTASCVRRAVQRQMVADVPVGAFLSGGLDSSAVVAFARELAPDIHCFTIEITGGQESGITDDLPYARKVAQHLNVPLDVVSIDAGLMANDFEDMVAQLDEPLADLAPLNVLYISQLARDHGMKVLLSGAGGDDLFTGYRRHIAVNYEHYWRWLPQGIRSILERSTSGINKKNPLFRRLAKFFDGAGLAGDARLANYFLWAKESQLLNLYTSEFREQLNHEVAPRPLLEFLEQLPDSLAPLERVLALEQRFFLSDHNLIYTDKMSMAAGVEVRVPFLDLDLVEHAARIPVELKQKGRVGKWVLKKAMEPYLPHDVIYRPKTGFGAPIRRWMQHEFKPLLGDLLSTDSLERRGLFDPIAVHRLIEENNAGRVDASYTLLSLLSIEIWCRSFLDKSIRPATIQARVN